MTDLEKLREEIARAMFNHEWAGCIQGVRDEVWASEDKTYWLDAADRILSIPTIADRLSLQPIAPMAVSDEPKR